MAEISLCVSDANETIARELRLCLYVNFSVGMLHYFILLKNKAFRHKMFSLNINDDIFFSLLLREANTYAYGGISLTNLFADNFFVC